MISATSTGSSSGWLSRPLTALIVLAFVFACLPSARAQTFTIHGNMPGFIKKAKDLGPTDPSTVISVTAWLKLHNQAKLDQLIHSQNEKGSANYEQWISQDQFHASFGPTAREVKAVRNFLSAKGLAVLTVAENNFYVKAQGTVEAIEKGLQRTD
jgi:subtilase family serine protease